MSRPFRPFDPFDRGPGEPTLRDITIPRPPRRFWIGLIFFGAALLLFFLASPIVYYYTERQWYQALGLQDVFVTRVALQFYLFAGSFLVAFLFASSNVLVALRYRSGTALRAVGIRRTAVLNWTGAAGIGAAALVALILSGGAGQQWQALILFLHSSPTGIADPVFNQDVSFYILSLPFIETMVNWALGLVFLTGLLVAVLYAWRGDTFDFRISPLAIGHLSGLLAVLAAIVAGSTFLGRYDLLSEHNGVVYGAGYADVNARIGVALVRTGLAVLLAWVLVANIFARRPGLAIGAVVAWIVVAIVGGLYPAAVQSFTVKPNELNAELPYIEREIAFTRHAYAMDQVSTKPYGGNQPLTAAAVASDRATIDNLRLWDTLPLEQTYEQLQTIRPYYTFPNIDLDRYTIDGKYEQVEISAREIDSTKLSNQAQGWVNSHLVYTHGYGVAASPVTAVVGEGLPDYVVSNLPPTGPLAVTKPAIYFGKATDTTVLAPSSQKEFDYPQGNADAFTNYTGSHGPRLDAFSKGMWSLRTGDFTLLISNQIQDRTEILFRRSIVQRAQAIAPFLSYDSDPYVVVVDGRVYWIMDAYTTASTYPYSQPEAAGENYIRNSVKIVVDAYEGTIDFYIADPNDPIIRAYQGAFPSLFKPLDAMPAGIRAHVRVPVDLFTIQSSVYLTYHVTDPRVFYLREDVWDFPTEQTGPNSTLQVIKPYYVLMRLPGETQAEYVQILPFTPLRKQNMIAWVAARNDGSHYGEIVSFQLPKDKVVFGPQQVANRIQETATISRDFSLLNQQGSGVHQGNLLVVPVGDAFLYFEPVYLQATQAQSLPELKKVILADSNTVAYSDSLAGALDQLVGQSTAVPGPSPPPVAGGGELAALAQSALQHYNAAFDALKKGDLATFAQEMAVVGQILQQMTGQPVSGPAASPSPGASPLPSGSPRSSPKASPTR